MALYAVCARLIFIKSNLRFKVRLLGGTQYVCRGDVKVQQDLSERWPVSGLTLPVNRKRPFVQ